MEFPRRIFKTEAPAEEKTSEKGEEIAEKSLEELLLEKREIEQKSVLGGGITDIEFVKLKDGGHGVFKKFERMDKNYVLGKSYHRERAAYLVDLFLGFDLVPTTVLRSVNGQEGSLQKYIEESKTGQETPPTERRTIRASQQGVKMSIFDYLIGNTDRHDSNFIIDKNAKLWAIDHHASFNKQYGTSAADLEMELFAGIPKGIPTETRERINDFVESKDKRFLLHKLLSELLEEKQVEDFFERLHNLHKKVL